MNLLVLEDVELTGGWNFLKLQVKNLSDSDWHPYLLTFLFVFFMTTRYEVINIS